MADRPYTVLSCCVSLDGCLGSATGPRLVLSGPEDLDRVDGLRAGSDAILVGAGTVRRDQPGLTVKAAHRRGQRAAMGLSESPAKVTLTGSGDLDRDNPFFTTGDGQRLVYCPTLVASGLRRRLGDRAYVVGLGAQVDLARVLEDLSDRGVGRLMVEGGGKVLAQVLAQGLADELSLAVAPVVVGDPKAPRLLSAPPRAATPSATPTPTSTLAAPAPARLRLVESQTVGDVVVSRYALSDRFGAA